MKTIIGFGSRDAGTSRAHSDARGPEQQAETKRALGFEAHVALREGVRRTIDWTREHLPLIDRCVQKHAARIPLV